MGLNELLHSPIMQEAAKENLNKKLDGLDKLVGMHFKGDYVLGSKVSHLVHIYNRKQVCLPLSTKACVTIQSARYLNTFAQ